MGQRTKAGGSKVIRGVIKGQQRAGQRSEVMRSKDQRSKDQKVNGQRSTVEGQKETSAARAFIGAT
eukprot:2899285-Rhodomonas_salina.2